MVEGEIIVVLGIANFVSACYTTFCVNAATKRSHWFHEAMHQDDLCWYAVWYSFKTIAFLVSASNSMVIYILTVRVLEWLHLLNQNLSTSSQADSWGGDRVYEKEQENESKQRNNRSRPHVLPMYKDCPFAPAPVKRWLSSRLRQIIAWGRGITATQIILLLASVAVVVAGLAAVWNIAFVPLAMADVGIRNREDALMVIPWS